MQRWRLPQLPTVLPNLLWQGHVQPLLKVNSYVSSVIKACTGQSHCVKRQPTVLMRNRNTSTWRDWPLFVTQKAGTPGRGKTVVKDKEKHKSWRDAEARRSCGRCWEGGHGPPSKHLRKWHGRWGPTPEPCLNGCWWLAIAARRLVHASGT